MNQIARRFLSFSIGSILALAVLPGIGTAAEVDGAAVTGAQSADVHVRSMRELKYADIVRQQRDFSCGAAALATILKYAYGLPVSEDSVIEGMLRVTDYSKVRTSGFSLLDLKRYADSVGLLGVGYKLPVSKLEHIEVPVIVLLNISGYEHFAVLKRVRGGYAYLADPALGNRHISAREFVSDWNGYIFAVAAPSYRVQNPLRKTERVTNAGGLSSAIPSTETALDNMTLTGIAGIAPTSRL